MNDNALIVAESEEIILVHEPAVRWYESITFDDARAFIRENIASVARSFIAVGYYLKFVRDYSLYAPAGYESVWEFAYTEYGISKSTASRYMAINDKFSRDGNSPYIAPEYKEFSRSQLQEMLYLNDTQLEQVTPETQVKQIREIRRETLTPYTGEQIPGQFSISDFSDYLPEEPEQEAAAVVLGKPVKMVLSIEDMIDAAESQQNDGGIAISQQESIPDGCTTEIDFKSLDKIIDLGKRGREDCKKLKALELSAVERQAIEAPEVKEEDNEEDIPYFTTGNHEAYGATRAAITKAYLDELHRLGLQSVLDVETETVIQTFGQEYLVEPGYDAEFWQEEKLWFKVEWQRLQYEYEYFYPERVRVIEPEASEPAPEEIEPVIDAAFTEVPDEEEYTLEYFLKEQNKELEDMLRVEMPRKPLERKKLIVCALAAMKADLEIAEFKKTYAPEQPQLPVLKNNDQRTAFVEAYETWPLWIETVETKERYYRYDLPDGSSMVIKVYFTRLFDYAAHDLEYEQRFRDGWGKPEYYLLRAEKHFKDCEVNKSYLVEYLKDLQKNKNQKTT